MTTTAPATEHRVALCRPLHVRDGGPRLVGTGRLRGVDYRVEAIVRAERVAQREFGLRFVPVDDSDPDLVLSGTLRHTPDAVRGVHHAYAGTLCGPASPRAYPLAAEVRNVPARFADSDDDVRAVDRTYVSLVIGAEQPREAPARAVAECAAAGVDSGQVLTDRRLGRPRPPRLFPVRTASPARSA